MQSDRTHKHTGGNVNNRVNVIKIKSLHRNIELSDHDAMHVAGVFMVANMQCINLVIWINPTARPSTIQCTDLVVTTQNRNGEDSHKPKD